MTKAKPKLNYELLKVWIEGSKLRQMWLSYDSANMQISGQTNPPERYALLDSYLLRIEMELRENLK